MPYLTMKAACAYLTLSRPTVLDLAREGKLRSFKFQGDRGRWKFTQADLDAFMSSLAYVQTVKEEAVQQAEAIVHVMPSNQDRGKDGGRDDDT